MLSSFRTLCAFLLVASSCSSVLSLPSAGKSALARRGIENYFDNILYLDANQTSLYAALSYQQSTYAAKIDNKWDGLLLHYGGNASQTTINVGGSSVKVDEARGEIGFLDSDIDLEYFHVSQWPSTLPTSDVRGVSEGYLGLDINNGMSPIYSYFSKKWPSDYSKWYYDIIITYDWNEKASNSEFAGLLLAGETLSWTNLFGIEQAVADKWGLPNVTAIDNQPPLYLTDDGAIIVDDTFTANGRDTKINSTVPKTQSGKAVVDIQLSSRWSMFPDEVVESLYEGMNDAKYVPQSAFGYWTIPCGARLTFSFKIDGKQYDADQDALIAPNPWGDGCIGTLFTKGQAVSAAPEYDITFGFQFMSSFYCRAGINHDNNKPYYKLLSINAPTQGWMSGHASGGISTNNSGGISTPAAAAQPTGASMGAIDTSDSRRPTGAPMGAIDTSDSRRPTGAIDTSASARPTTTAFVTIRPSFSTIQPPLSFLTTLTAFAAPTGDAVKAAGNLATEDDEASGDNWKSKAQLFEILTIVFAGLFAVLLATTIVMFVRARRNKRNGMRPSAYSTLHATEAFEPKAALYDAEGGHSKYDDPYRDTQ
ncbi:hypothetical protein C8Q80DRAFT_1128042 [Daedaleopsis nitida]|nr:hypothetical protein C8Q80DRAFT_1128042 [Daedaleopsis nitida]